MTLRLDQETSRQLQQLAAATGRSQQKLVHEAVRQFLDSSAEAVRERQRRWQRAMHRGKVCVPLTTMMSPPQTQVIQSPVTEERNPYPNIDPAYVERATGPLQHPSQLIPSPPGGILAYLDREDRFEV